MEEGILVGGVVVGEVGQCSCFLFEPMSRNLDVVCAGESAL